MKYKSQSYNTFRISLVFLSATDNNVEAEAVSRGKIFGTKTSGMSGSAISQSIDRSKTVINNFLKNPFEYGKCKHPGRPSALSKRQNMTKKYLLPK